ncbi:MAG TPA: DUF1800 domain-containing protein [Bacteroidota bacterium]|nr:DUF1800 domain-containing protein [Bacteroidota bacterium]
MDRRSFITSPAEFVSSVDDSHDAGTSAVSQFANKTLPRIPHTSSGLDPLATVPTHDQIAHLLRRTMFGARETDVATLLGMSISGILSTLLADQPAPAPPLNTSSSDTTVPIGQTWVTAAKLNADGTNPNGARITSFKSWWIGRMLSQGISLVEKMTLFWHNHFVSETAVVGDARFSYMQNALFRQYALGNFRTLAGLVTIDPAMLRYLNGNTNTKSSPNENYGRELQELFTIGKGTEISPGNYTYYSEADVQTAAKVLTGWRDDQTNLNSYFTLSRHDTTNKQFSSDYQNTLVTGSSDPGGLVEINAMLDMIFAQTETARYICRKFYRWFVYYVIDDVIEANIIDPLASILISNNYEVKPVLETLLASQHFFDPANVGCVIKNPIDLSVGMCRQMNMAFPSSSALATQYNHWNHVRTQAAGMQLDPGDPPNVAGWPAYYQSPEFHELWINSDTLPKRNQYTDTLNGSGYKNGGFTLAVDPIAFVNTVSNPSDPNVIVSEFAQRLFPIALTANQIQFLHDILLPGLPDYEWTAEWTDYQNNPTDSAKQAAVQSKLQALLTFMMDMAEFQLM